MSNEYIILLVEIVEFFFVDTTPFVDKYFNDPEDEIYDWKAILPRRNYLSNLLKVISTQLLLFFLVYNCFVIVFILFYFISLHIQIFKIKKYLKSF